MLGPGGFSSARDIAAITVNRWPHGYGYVANSLFDPDDYEDAVLKVARQPRHRRDRQSDAGGDAWAHFAIDQADARCMSCSVSAPPASARCSGTACTGRAPAA